MIHHLFLLLLLLLLLLFALKLLCHTLASQLTLPSCVTAVLLCWPHVTDPSRSKVIGAGHLLLGLGLGSRQPGVATGSAIPSQHMGSPTQGGKCSNWRDSRLLLLMLLCDMVLVPASIWVPLVLFLHGIVADLRICLCHHLFEGNTRSERKFLLLIPRAVLIEAECVILVMHKVEDAVCIEARFLVLEVHGTGVVGVD